MVWTAPRTWTDGEVVTGATMNTHVRDNLIFLRTAHAARLYNASLLTHNSNGNYLLTTWDTEDYDTDAIASTTTEDFIVPTGFDGKWQIRTYSEWAGNATGVRHLRIKKNETYSTRTPNAVGVELRDTIVSNLGGNNMAQECSWTGPLAAADRITIESFQSSGGNLNQVAGISIFAAEAIYLGS